MVSSRACQYYYSEDYANYIVEYRGNFKEQIDKISYACGDIITRTIGVISVSPENLDRLKIDVPAIILVETRSTYVLQQLPYSVSPSDIDNITPIKINPYLNLSGKGVLIGIVDTGIDYLNKEFLNEDNTSRIRTIWDQTIPSGDNSSIYMGKTYSNEEINKAIIASTSGEDPYKVVPSTDDIGHGTKVSSIIGAKGYNSQIEGIANDCEFVVVKLQESLYNKKILENNGVSYIPTFNNSELIAGLEFLKNFSITIKKPMVIFFGIGTTEGSHDGNSLISKYITNLAVDRGIVIVAGTGNQADSDGHASGIITSKGTIKTIELSIPKDIKHFALSIWVSSPNIMSVNIISPTGEMTDFIKAKAESKKFIKFTYTVTTLSVQYHLPEAISGNEDIRLLFNDIKPGIWKIQLRGELVISAQYDIWLPPIETLPEGTKFLEPSVFSTLTIPSSARKVVTVAYYDSVDNASSPTSGKGFNTNNLINPDVTTGGINILTTAPNNKITTLSGSSAATAITTGVCALLLQWAIINGNDLTMYSIKMRSYLLYGADRDAGIVYPNRDTGFGFLNILGTFNIISGSYRGSFNEEFIEYSINNLFVRLPKEMGGSLNV